MTFIASLLVSVLLWMPRASRNAFPQTRRVMGRSGKLPAVTPADLFERDIARRAHIHESAVVQHDDKRGDRLVRNRSQNREH
ncbi:MULTISPECIES: hypothetical protein [unclassified Caballeronia]|uniref:hypothetical protein n=1 Tax=unclassified Caballeronia TaxID=2646786 RepID=UPI00285BE406|nr:MULTISPECIES: hypothetical protein [unclassified Caballeronia]MDR5751050.1 hypothetical protein [Caballeronia sp. LZ024]MDR5844815.1 hypothetical protein [Caballeronia sp. LZ031]